MRIDFNQKELNLLCDILEHERSMGEPAFENFDVITTLLEKVNAAHARYVASVARISKRNPPPPAPRKKRGAAATRKKSPTRGKSPSRR